MCFLLISKVHIAYEIVQLKPYLAVAKLLRQYDVIMLESQIFLQADDASCLQFAKNYSFRALSLLLNCEKLVIW